jgi:hypothetical protein
MSNIALVAIVVGALATVLTIAAVGAIVTQRISRALHDATAAAERLTAASAVIDDQQRVTRRELDRLHTSLEGLRDSRDRR